MKEADQKKTAYTSYHGLYRFIGMLFGLRNASETFQLTPEVLLFTVKWQFARLFLENDVILSRYLEKLIGQFCNLQELFCNADVASKLEKCQFFYQKDCLYRTRYSSSTQQDSLSYDNTFSDLILPLISRNATPS